MISQIIEKVDPFTKSGIIGRSGQWHSCETTKHIKTMLRHDDAPYVEIKGGYAMFDAYDGKCKPNKAQFETLMNWCTVMGKRFEDVVTGYWSRAWEEWREPE